jgi:S1-C subfamily serine protease
MVGVSSDGSTNNDIGAFTARCVRMTGDGDVIAVGAPFGDGNATDSGVVRVYGYAG